MKYSIIIVAYNRFDLLDKCIESLSSVREDGPAEVIVVDNTPGDRTLEEIKVIDQADHVYRDGTNHGFAGGCNIGARIAQGEILIFLNPDTEVYGDWADRMAKHLAAPSVGAVGPITNYAAGLQNAKYHMEPKDSSVPVQTKMLIGFCLMMRRDTWDEMGGMDANLFLGYDDLDLSWRLQRAGYTLLIAPDVYVHHHGHKSFETEPAAQERKWLRESEETFRAKLHAYYHGAPPSALDLWGVDMMNTAMPRPMTLSVCMIVRDEEQNLRELLPQLSFADEIVLVDTGTPPTTMTQLTGLDPIKHVPGEAWEPLGAFGPTGIYIGFHHLQWCDDFAASRNFALSKCTGDWVLWLDADDRVPETAGRLIRAALDKPGPHTWNRKCYFSFLVEDIGADGRPAHVFAQPRLFPRLPGLEWTYRIHESIVPAADKLGLFDVPTDITIQHTGYADHAKLAGKVDRNLRILALDPPSPARHWNAGNALGMGGRWEEALTEYELALMSPWEEPLNEGFLAQVKYCAVRALFNLGRLEAMGPYLEGLGHPDAHFMAARLWEARSDRLKAIGHYREYLDFTAKAIYWPWETDTPTLRPAAYASLIRLLEEEFHVRHAAFKADYPHCFRGIPA